MKRSSKSIWIYASVLMVIAIGLILITSFAQAKLYEHDGGFED